MLKRFFVGAALLGAMTHGAAALAQSPASSSPQTADAPPPTPIDYSDSKTWLCRPGRHDACAVDLTTTVVAADGTLTRETWTADPERADRLLLRLPDDLHRSDAEQRHERRPGRR